MSAPPPQHQPVFFSQASGMPLPQHPGHSPYKYTAPPPYPTLLSVPQSTPPFVMLHPSETSSGQSPGRRSRSQSGRGQDSSGSEHKRARSKSPRHSSVDGGRRQQQQVLMPAGMPAGAYAPVELYYPYVPPPMPSYGHAPYGPAPPWLPEYDAYYNPQFYDYSQYMMYPPTTRGRRSTSSRTSKRPRSKSGNRQQGGGGVGVDGGPGNHPGGAPPGPTSDPIMRRPKKNKNKKGQPSDSDIEKTYTGLDRELAEEFIETTMAEQPGGQHIIVDHQRNLQSGTESEAW